MKDETLKPPEGRFYVDHEDCIAHECCIDGAPELFALSKERYLAYVVRQPRMPEEVVLFHEAMQGCPVSAIHDREHPEQLI